MSGKLDLNLDNLAVDSLETSPAPTKAGTVVGQNGEAPATCLQTNCGHILCCA